MKGKFIVIDGLDGSGKGTQTKILVKRLREEGHRVEMVDFPRYGNPTAYFVEKYLRGEFGSSSQVGPKKASLFYALDRYAASFQIRKWLEEGVIVISNRYVSASKGHQLGKLQDPTQMHEFLAWLNDLEYETLHIPKPNLTLFLHMRPEFGQTLVDKKAAREYIGGKKRDIHEADLDHLQNAERAYLFCVENDPAENWEKLVCFTQNGPRPIREIHDEIYAKVLSLIKES